MKRIFALILAICMMLCALTGCGKEDETMTDEKVTVRIGGLTGPTSMGMVKLMDEGSGDYEFSLKSEASAFTAAIAKGELDIAAVPANLASVIYNNTDGAVKLLAVNTLGVLYLVERGDSVHSLKDIVGKTVYATGAGSAPEYALRYLMSENGIDADKDVRIQWCADTTEALSYIVNDTNALAMLPQPFVTAAQTQVSDLNIAIDLNKEWEALENGSAMVTGVLIVRSEFAEKHPQQLKKFMDDYEASVSYVLNNTEEAAQLIGKYDIVKAPIALKALPYCNITFITGAEMKSEMEAYLKVLYDMNSASIGGKLPGSDFYYGS